MTPKVSTCLNAIAMNLFFHHKTHLLIFFYHCVGSNSFDREQKSVHTFLVLASDGTRTGTSRVRVEISDQNDEEPIFDEGPYVRYVRENEEPSHHVGYVVAKDRDEGSNAMITYSLKTGMDKFSIEPNTGLIRTKVKLDRESNDNEFKVIVVGTDQGINPKKGEVDVTIMVTDANDQEPIFSRSIFNAQVEECGAIGQEVTQVIKTPTSVMVTKCWFQFTRVPSPRKCSLLP